VHLTIDWIHLAILVAGVQGFLLAGTLAAHRSNRTANRLLAALVAAFTVYLLEEVYYSAGLVRTYPHLFGFSYPLPWVFGPLVYLYAVAASDRAWRFERRQLIHFAPVVVVVIASMPLYLMHGAEKIALFDRLQSGDVPMTVRVLDPTKYISGLAYSVATVAYLRRHRRRVENSYSNTERVNLRWLLWLTGAALAIWVLATWSEVSGLIPMTVRQRSDDLVSLGIAIVVYGIGYMGLRQPEIFRYEDPESSAPTAVVQPAVEPIATPLQPSRDAETPEPVDADETRDARYARSGLSEAEAAALKAELLALMTKERPYREPDLTLSALAERLDTTPHKLSEVLNAEIGQTFYDFINRYRVDEVRRRLANDEARNLNVLTLAMDAGFASKSTFNQVFKKQTGHTPSTYRRAAAR